MQLEIVNGISTQISAIESAEAVLIRASDADCSVSRSLIEASLFIIRHAVEAARGYLEAACTPESRGS